MNLQELRSWLTRELRVEIPDKIWAKLVERRYAKPEMEDEADLKDLRDAALDYLEIWWAGKASGGGPRPPGRDTRGQQTEEIAVDLTDRQALRAHVFSQIAAQMAENHPDVKRFRKLFLNNVLLTADQAGEFLAEHGELVGGKDPAITELRRLGENLAKYYRWRFGDAMWFVLAGGIPPVSPLRAEGSVRSSIHGPDTATITLTIEPWVDAKEVDRVYRDLQRQMLGNKDNRTIGERRLRLLQFVEDQKRTGSGGWRTWMQRWNETYPQWKYEDKEHPDHAVRYFKRSDKETYDRLMYPYYHFPNWKSHAPTPYQSWRNAYLASLGSSQF